MARKKVNNKNIRVINDDTLAKPNQDLSLLDKKVKKVKHDIKDDDILVVKNLRMYFPINTGVFKTKNLKAVDDVSFTIKRGETLGLVGESGCGKTTLGRTILHLYDPTSGLITFNDHPIITKKDLKNFRKKATVVFQDPYSSLNPRMTVADIIGEPIDVHNICDDIVKERHFGKITQLEKELDSLKAYNLEHSHEEKKLKEAIDKKQVECDTLDKTCNNDFIVGQIVGEKNRSINDHISTLWREYDELINLSKNEISNDKKRIGEIRIEIKSKEKECNKLKAMCEDSSVVKSIIKEKKDEHRLEIYNAKLELEKFKNNFIDQNPNADVYQSEYKKKQEDYRKLKKLDVLKEIESKMADKISRRKKARVEAYENALKDLKNSKELLNAALKNLEASKSKFENELKEKHELCLKEEKTPKITSTDVENNQKAEVARRLKLAQEAKKQADGELNDLTTQLSSLQEKNKAKIASLEKELEKRTVDYDKVKGKEKVSYDDIKNKYAKEVEQKVADNKVKVEAAIKDLADFKVKVKKDKTLRTEYRYKKRALDLLKEKSSANNIIKALYNEKNADVIKEEKEYNAFVRAYHFALDNECYDIKSLVNYELKLDEYKQVKEETKIPYFLLKFEAKEERKKRILQLMSDVGLSPEQSTRYAHSFSGGQRQRIGIARALASNPEFIVCDEPVSALDVSIQAQILNTFQELQKKLGLTYLFVAHNLLVVKHISDRIAVMYLGHIVELCESEELYKHPLHPYTISLLSAIPEPDPNRARANKRQILEGEIPSPLHVPSGCPFRLRCPRATDQCTETRPELIEVKKGHFTACHLVKPATKK